MMRLSYIRFGTYAMVIAGLILAQRRGYIPVNLVGQHDVDIEFERDFYHGGLAPAKALGFQDSRLSGHKVMERVRVIAQEEAIDLLAYGSPKIALHQDSGILRWYITFEAVDEAHSFQILRVVIEDESEKAYVEQIERRA